MMLWIAFAASLPALAAGGGTWYSVSNIDDSGMGSLRWAIENANLCPGTDPVYLDLLPGALSGAIQPLTPLPTLTRDKTTIDGDVDDNGKPDAWLDGELQDGGSGLVVAASNCNVVGLCVTRFPKYGVMLSAADHCTVYSCHLGVSPDGTDRLANPQGDIVLWVSDYNQIGGPLTRNRNIIAGSGACSTGLFIANSHYNKVQTNYFGLRRSGMSALPGQSGYGVYLTVTGSLTPTGAAEPVSDRASTPMTCLGNTIGGTRPAQRNVFGNLPIGVMLSMAEHNFIQGNYFGLAKDGDTPIPLTNAAVCVYYASTDNLIGGSSAGARNVFAAGAEGVTFMDTGTVSNRVLGNYFGLNAAGTAQRPLACGVRLFCNAGAQTIGGATASCGNYFAPNGASETFGVNLATAGEGTLIRNNRFGVRPDGPNASLMGHAITVGNVRATIADNLIARAKKGIDVGGPAGNARAYRNTFRNCIRAVRVTNLATCFLGNLQNASTNDDGGNAFRSSNVWHIDNRTADRIRAEGSSFGTTVRSEIDAKIYDKLDNAAYGRVDFIPLSGGVIPTATEGAALALASVSTQPTPRGAEIAFALSAPAGVTIEMLNIAGRPVALVQQDAPTEAGLQRVLWSGRTAAGTSAPPGAYLVRLSARDADGRQAGALATLRLLR